MKTVYTKEELTEAINSGETRILAKEEIAKSLITKHRCKVAAKIGCVALTICSLIAIPFTGGTSAFGVGINCLRASGTALGTFSLSTTELSIICGTGVSLFALSLGKKINFQYKKDGTVEINIE